jgi:ribonuclease R
VPWKSRPEPRHFEQIVQQVKGRDDQHLVMAVLLRAQSLANYQAVNTGHFGLALTAYAHFTSPIRR